jgi:hypothetical protein
MVVVVADILDYLKRQLHRPMQYLLLVVAEEEDQVEPAQEIKAVPEVDNMDKPE